MITNTKLYYKYILSSVPFTFIDNFLQRSKNTSVLTPTRTVSYVTNHKRLSVPFYSTQLSDIFAYDLPLVTTRPLGTEGYGDLASSDSSVVVYNFHSFLSQERFFLFASVAPNSLYSTVSKVTNTLDSIAELFMSANWLEREASELSGLPFAGKKDLRNLMLQFGDLTAPLRKAFPAVGLRDLYYDPTKDMLVQAKTSLQS